MQGVDHFLEAKGKADVVKAGKGLNELVGALHSLTSLRATLISKLSSGESHQELFQISQLQAILAAEKQDMRSQHCWQQQQRQSADEMWNLK